MKNIFCAFLILALMCRLGYCTDFYWGNNSGTDWGNWGVNWTYQDGTEASSPPGSADNAIFDVSIMEFSNGATMTRDETIDNLVFRNHYTETDGVKTGKSFSIYVRSGKGSHNLNILGNLVKERGEYDASSYITSGSADDRITVNVLGKEGESDSGNIVLGDSSNTGSYKGDLHLGGSSISSSLAKLTVAGNINLYWGGSLYLNVGQNSGTIENPDVVINGVINYNGSGGDNPTFRLQSCTDGNEFNTVIQVGGAKGNGVMRTESGTKGSATLVFANAAGTSYEYNGYIISNSPDTKIKIVMNGEGTQILRPTWEPDLYFSFNGLEVRKGTMEIFTVSSVGDIELTGGNLKAIGATAKLSTETSSSLKNAQLHGDNLIWTSGKILTNISMDQDGNALASMIYLSGALKKGEGFTKAEFEFSGDVLFYLDEWIQIMSFEDGAEDFDASDFVANTFNDEWGAKFKRDNNALYVMYTAIPEPAAAAAVLGALVLGIAAWKKRK